MLMIQRDELDVCRIGRWITVQVVRIGPDPHGRLSVGLCVEAPASIGILRERLMVRGQSLGTVANLTARSAVLPTRLAITLTVDQTVRIGDDVRVTFEGRRSGGVLLGFKAPRSVEILREELCCREGAPC